MKHKYAAIILAAGSSSRLGTPKQLVQYEGQTLLQRALQAAVNAGFESILVVTGANSEIISQDVRGTKARIVMNEDWKEGIASSIRKGIIEVENSIDEVLGAVIMVCDQPYCDAALLNRLISEQEDTGKAVVASSYGNTIGTPVLFQQEFFEELKQLRGDSGAKKLLQAHAGRVATVVFEKGEIDIDNPEDLHELKTSK